MNSFLVQRSEMHRGEFRKWTVHGGWTGHILDQVEGRSEDDRRIAICLHGLYIDYPSLVWRFADFPGT